MAANKRPSTKSPARAAAKANVASPAAVQRAGKAADRDAMTNEDRIDEEAHLEPLNGERPVAELGDDLVSGKKALVTSAAPVIDALLEKEPEAVVPIIDRFVKAVAADDKRAAQTAAMALPIMARVAPARVARHLQKLKDGFDAATPVGKDGLVRTFAGLCTASVAYQKRLEGVLNKALGEADAKTLQKWTEVVLPALKGEPHARARATVEARLERIPKAVAQKIADFLGIKLRLRYR